MTSFRMSIAAVVVALALFAAPGATAVTAETLHITHDLGTAVIQPNPQRVIVFDYGVLDSLERLNIDVIGLPKSNVPSYLSRFGHSRYADAGTLQEPNFEAINALKPDLIIISGRMAAHYDELARLAPTLYMAVDHDAYLDSVVANVETLGRIFGVEAAAEAELSKLLEDVARVQSLAADDNALMLLVTGGRANAYGLGSRYGFIHEVFGLAPVDTTITASTHGQVISWEYVLVHDPDLLFVIDRDAVVEGGGWQTARQVVENELVRLTTAYAEGNIFYLDPSYWYLSGGGLTSLEMMLADVESALTRTGR